MLPKHRGTSNDGIFRVARRAVVLAASLGRFVFTVRIGENAVEVHSLVWERLRWMGVMPDLAANAGSGAVVVHLVPTDEEAMTMRHVLACVAR